MADEEQNEQTENEQVEETPEETVSAPEASVAPAAESEAPATEEAPPEEPTAEEEPAAEEPAAEEAVAEEPAEAAPEAEAEPVAEGEAEAAEAPEGEAPTEEAAADEAEAPVAEASTPKKKPKRLPRSLRHRHSKSKRERPAERKPITRLAKPEHPRGRSQERRGVVVSSAMDKTIVVRVDAVKAHPKYKKVVRRSTKFHAHDEQNQAKVGDVVRIVETRPLSKTKNWRLAEIVEVAQ